ncbi:MAG: hypothetical protein LBE12_18365 [Planctomycetaceae bacterium]|jgi:ankyrin repeat protein|nr:hypothetical protein [Planctomycetaceae bacterium]
MTITDILLVGFSLFLVVLFPLLFGVWLFWSGKWRLPVLVGGTMLLGFVLLEIFVFQESYIPPEKRFIYCNNYQGSDIYCNGVYLGQTPFQITVKELVAKVPEWTSPPEQSFYSENSDTITYTWYPWDDFRKEQFLKTRMFVSERPTGLLFADEQKKQMTYQYETDCRYWWRLENNKCRIVIKKSNHYSYLYDKPFEKIPNYSIFNDTEFLSAPIHAWVLAQVLEELTESEKNTWDRHVLKHWQSLAFPLTSALKTEDEKAEDENYRLKNHDDMRVKVFETALDSTARLRYGLSNPPTEEECRRLLANWVDESMSYHHRQSFSACTNNYKNIGDDPIYHSAGSFSEERFLIDTAIRLMGETIQKPLIEQWKTNYYRTNDGWTPLLYVAQTNHDAEYFNELARYLAASQYGQLELLENQNEQVIPLFKTFLYQKKFIDMINDIINRNENFCYSQNIISYSSVNNPLLEPVFREYIVHALSDPKLSNTARTNLNETVIKVSSDRLQRENIDKKKLAVWVESLPLPQLSKDLLVQNARSNFGETKSFFDFLKITVEDVNRWFAEHPKGTIGEFCSIFWEDLALSADAMFLLMNNVREQNTTQIINFDEHAYKPALLVRALLNINTPETQKTIKQIFNNDITGRHLVLGVIREKFGINQTHIDYKNSLDLLDISRELPDFVLDIIDTLNKFESPTLARILVLCPSPKAEQILEKWTRIEDDKLKQIFLRHLANWRKRKEILEQNKQFFYDLVDEKILPDDLLVPSVPWVWKDIISGYVNDTK